MTAQHNIITFSAREISRLVLLTIMEIFSISGILIKNNFLNT